MGKAAISENVSKKGRPRMLSDEHYKLLKSIYGESRTRRSLQNHYYGALAHKVLQPMDGLAWLFDERKFQSSILVELGRYGCEYGEEAMGSLADEICKRKPSARDGIALIRRCRLGDKKPDSVTLANRIITCINDYLHRHPLASMENIQEALDVALIAFHKANIQSTKTRNKEKER